MTDPFVPDVDPTDIRIGAGVAEVSAALKPLLDGRTIVVDLETRGTSPLQLDAAIVGVGVAWRTDSDVGALYFDYSSMEDASRSQLWQLLALASGSFVEARLVAFNLMFEGLWITHEMRRLGLTQGIKWSTCAFALFKQLSSEGWPGQSHSLKAAQVELLGWPDTNEGPVEEWLLSHGHHRQGPDRAPDATPAQHLASIAAWISINPEKRSVRPDKAEMWRVPPDILGTYCILDCLSTLQLLEEVLDPALERFPELAQWHQDVFVEADRLLYEQILFGIRVDRAKLVAHGDFLRASIAEAERQMRAHPVLGERVRALDEEYINLHRAKEPERFKKMKLGAEPPRLKKDGSVSKVWEKWFEKSQRKPAERADWVNWRHKLDALEAGRLPECRFNPSSDAQMRRLLWGDPEIGEPPLLEWRATDRTAYKKGAEIPIFEIKGIYGWVDIEATESGHLPTNGDLFTQFPEDIRNPLQLNADASQELGYVETYLELLRWDAATETWRLHPGWVSPGTKTHRLAGKDPNLQQIPKTKQLMACFIADEGEEWIEMDWSALEPHVLAEISRDPALLKLYGPGAPNHDVYLYSGAGYAVFGEEVRRHYDVDNPDVKGAKRALKDLREAILKTFFLGKGYGAGWKKLQSQARLKGRPLTDEQAQQISESHDTLYEVSGKKFHRVLEREWRGRGGWILSGLGHPICVDGRYTKDLINRLIQKTGHDIHTTFYVRVARRLEAEGIRARGIVWDFHDQLIASVPKGQAVRALEIVREEVAALNEWLGSFVPLKGEPKLSTNLAHAKEAEFDWDEHPALRAIAPPPSGPKGEAA